MQPARTAERRLCGGFSDPVRPCEFVRLFPGSVDSWNSRSLARGFRIFERECFEEFDKVTELFRTQMAGLAMLIAGVAGGEHIQQSGSAAVVKVGGAER